MRKNYTLILLFSIWFLKPVFGQETISVKDTAEINYRAELVLSEYRDLMNIVSNNSVDAKQSRDVIVNSYTNNENQIFTDSSVQVEDDINPEIHGTHSSKDLAISTYLRDLDLFYTKSDTMSVEFSNVRLSNVKSADYIYIKVYYQSLFKNKNTSSSALYNLNDRVAELKMEKKGNKWTGTIIRIAFMDPSLVEKDTLNNLTAISGSSRGEAAVVQPGTSGVGGYVNDEIQDKNRQREVDQYKIIYNKYKILIGHGDEFLKSNDYASAMKSFSDAQELMPYELYPKLKMNEIRKLADQTAINSAELYKEFIVKAQLAENERQYENAKEYYQKALLLEPAEKVKYDAKMVSLDTKIRNLSIFEDKYNSGLYEEDIKDFNAIIKKDKTNSDYYLGRGKCYDKLNNYKRALEDYAKSIELDHNNLQSLKCRAVLYSNNNEFFKALEDYKIYLTIEKNDFDVYRQRAVLHTMTNNTKAAMEDLNNGIHENPKSSALYFDRGLLLYRTGNTSAAIEDLTTAKQLDTNNAVIYYYLGVTNVNNHSIIQGAKWFEFARGKGLDSSFVKQIETLATDFYDWAESHMQKEIFDSAIIYYRDAVLINPYSEMFRYKIGEYYFQQNDLPQADNFYTQALDINKSFQQAYYKRGVAYFRQKEFDNCVVDQTAYLKLNPSDYNGEKYLGASLFQLEKYDDCINHLEICLRLMNSQKYNDPTDVGQVYNLIGKSHFELSELDPAMQSFKMAIRSDKSFAEAYYNRGHTYYKLHELGNATDDLIKATSLEDRPDWYKLLGDVSKEKKDYGLAVMSYSSAIIKDSSALVCALFYNRGLCYALLKNFQNAIADYRKCIRLDCDSIKGFYIEVGNAYLNAGDYDSAYTFYNKAYSANNNDPNALLGIASSLFLKDKVDESLEWFEKAFKTNQISYSSIKHDASISGIRSNRKFKDLIKKYYP